MVEPHINGSITSLTNCFLFSEKDTCLVIDLVGPNILSNLLTQNIFILYPGLYIFFKKFLSDIYEEGLLIYFMLMVLFTELGQSLGDMKFGKSFQFMSNLNFFLPSIEKLYPRGDGKDS